MHQLTHTSRSYWGLGVTISGVAHSAAAVVLVVHWMLGGTLPQFIPPPRGVVSIDLQASWASDGSGQDGQSKAFQPVRIVPSDEVTDQELSARTIAVVPVGTLPPISSQRPLDAEPEATSLSSAQVTSQVNLADRERAEPEVREPPAFPRNPRARRAGAELPDTRTTEAWIPPSASSRRTDGAQAEATPRKVFSPEPEYPPDLLAARVTGVVKLLVLVRRDGTVERARVHLSSGHAALDHSALSAVRRWRFEPARRAGQPISVEILVPVRFTIRS
ncbi:MAG: energy transducer TonB [Pirellulaceae bacterium]|nr:energy transducer TonB [Pirellulaceae bacterium]